MERYYDILGLGCAHCGGKIEEAINKLEEVENAVLNFPMKRLKVKGKHSDELLAKMNELARNIEPDVEIVASQEQHHEHHHDHEGECCEHEHHHHHHEGECCGHEHHHEHSHEHHGGVKLTVNDLGCAHCGGKIAEAIGQLEGVEAAELNFPMRQLIIHGKITDELLEKMNSIAGRIEPGVTITAPKTQEKEAHHEHGTEMKKELAEVAVGVLLFAAALIVHKAAHIMPLAIVLYAAAYLVLGRGVLAVTL
ncbi:MAG TPA: cation transporter, partial [Ruminococcus sp.]|nr:cation transporter [Ruminococcus sp.]